MLQKLFDWMDKGGKFSHILMLGIGGYLFYAVYRMVSRLGEMESSKVPVYIASVLFVIIGTGMVAVGGLALLTGHYKEKVEESAASAGTEAAEEDSEAGADEDKDEDGAD